MIDFQVKKISMTEDAKKLLSHFHYLKTLPSSVQHSFGLFNTDEKILGVCTFSHFSRLQTQKKYQGHIELSRLYVVEEAPKNTESFFLGSCLRWLSKNTDLLGAVTYADPTAGHHGTIYRAANFTFIGKSSRSYHYENGTGQRIHKKQVWQRAKENSVSESLQSKIEGLKKHNEDAKNIFIFTFKRKKKVIPKAIEAKPKIAKASKKVALAREIVRNLDHSVGIYASRNGQVKLTIVAKRRQFHLGYFDSKEAALSYFDKEIKS